MLIVKRLNTVRFSRARKIYEGEEEFCRIEALIGLGFKKNLSVSKENEAAINSNEISHANLTYNWWWIPNWCFNPAN